MANCPTSCQRGDENVIFEELGTVHRVHGWTLAFHCCQASCKCGKERATGSIDGWDLLRLGQGASCRNDGWGRESRNSLPGKGGIVVGWWHIKSLEEVVIVQTEASHIRAET